MKNKILYLVLTALTAGSISITSCSSEKKADAVKRDSVMNSVADSANEPDATKMKKDSV
jgi:hypothetical protein